MLAAQNVQMLSDLYYALIHVTVLFNREQITIDVRIIGVEMFNAESIPNILIDQFILIVTSVFTSLTRITELVSSNKCILWFSWSKQQNNASLQNTLKLFPTNSCCRVLSISNASENALAMEKKFSMNANVNHKHKLLQIIIIIAPGN